METEPVREIARAKLNLCLHVTGKRPDGYHLLDSLVAFASVGDEVTASLAPTTTLRVTGPEASGLEGEADNLVLRAARLMGVSADLTLEKVLPVASGVGGGSADAAATLRALSRLSGRPLPDADKVLALGADVPVCLLGQAARMRGIGERISRLPDLPKAWLLMVNPRQPVSTPAAFARLTNLDNPPIPELPTSGWTSVEALSHWLRVMTRNDLEDPAMAIAPAIGKVLAALSRTRSCLLARMSGSGATCFGLFGSEAASLAASDLLKARHPDWWIRQAALQTGR